MAGLPFTPEQLEILRKYYPDKATKDVAEMIGRDVKSVWNKAKALGISKSEAFHQSGLSGRILKGQKRGIGSEFQKGMIPFNKGKKQSDFLSPEAIERTKATRFKKGRLPPNTKADFDITIRAKKDGSEAYKYIRIGLGKWVLYHRYLWQQEYGEIPKGMMLTFKNRDTMDCRLENLELISRAENARRNHNYEKAMLTNPFHQLSDNYVAFQLTRKEPHLKEEILKHPDIIKTAKLNFQLNRKIKQHEK